MSLNGNLRKREKRIDGSQKLDQAVYTQAAQREAAREAMLLHAETKRSGLGSSERKAISCVLIT